MAEAVRGYVADVVGCSPADVTGITGFGAGERHAVYRASYADPRGRGRDVVARVLYSGAPEDRAMAQREAKVLEVVGGIGAPRLYDFRAESVWFATPAMCLEYVAGSHEADLGGRVRRVSELGELMGRLHMLRVDDLGESFPAPPNLAVYAQQYVDWIVGRIAAVDHALPRRLQPRMRRAARTFARRWEQVAGTDAFSTDAPPALLHGDVGPGNLLWAPGPVLIDWEYARLGDPADDIGYIFAQNGLTGAQREAFWAGYQVSSRERSTDSLAERARWWEAAGLIGSAAWWAECFGLRFDADAKGHADPSVPRETGYYLEQVERRLDRFSELADA